MERIAVVAACRTPIGRFLGVLSPLSAVELGAAAVRGLLARAQLPADQVDEVVFGQARQLGSGPNPARQVAIGAGIPESAPAFTVNKACGSGLKAIDLARAGLLLDGHRVVVAGGMESMTNIPFLVPALRRGARLGHADVLDGNYRDGFTCPLVGAPMGMTAEFLAEDRGIGREEQDVYALESHRRASRAQAEGRFRDEIEVLEVPGRGGPSRVAEDEHVRPDVTLEGLARLPPVFRPDGGTVHAGNSSGITDGAAALLLMTEAEVQRRGFRPLAWLGPSAVRGVAPRVMGIGPVPAVRALWERTGTTAKDYDLIELNEAFAVQVLACQRDLQLDLERLNVNGGAIALGHPIGASGARIVVTLLHELARRGARRGLATLCMSGGMGMATAFERPVA